MILKVSFYSHYLFYMNESYKRLIDMNEGEIENLIRRIIREEFIPNPVSQISLADQEFLTIKQASQFIKYSVSSLYRKISERAIPFHKIGQKRVAFKPGELVEWVKSHRKGHKSKLLSYSKNQ